MFIARSIFAAVLLFASAAGPAAAQDALSLARSRLPALLALTPATVPALRKKAEAGDATSMAVMGEAYTLGFGGLTISDEKAAYWLRKAAAAGLEGADREAAFLEFKSDYAELITTSASTMEEARAVLAAEPSPPGTLPDPGLVRLAELGFTDAQMALAAMYSSGRGADADQRLAARWLSAAAAGGDAEANYRLGIVLYRGIGVASDEKAAVERFEEAAKRGSAGAEMALGDIAESRQTEESGPLPAMQWYYTAAADGWPGATEKFNSLASLNGVDAALAASTAAAEWREARARNSR